MSPTLQQSLLLNIHSSWLSQLAFYEPLTQPYVPRPPLEPSNALPRPSLEHLPCMAGTPSLACPSRRASSAACSTLPLHPHPPDLVPSRAWLPIIGRYLLSSIALRMQPVLYIPRERPPAKRLYVIVKGANRYYTRPRPSNAFLKQLL